VARDTDPQAGAVARQSIGYGIRAERAESSGEEWGSADVREPLVQVGERQPPACRYGCTTGARRDGSRYRSTDPTQRGKEAMQDAVGGVDRQAAPERVRLEVNRAAWTARVQPRIRPRCATRSSELEQGDCEKQGATER
jgi:hypothetical protein